MSFAIKVWVSPKMYEALYSEMTARGHNSMKQTIRELLLTADEATIERAIELAKYREAQR